MSNQDSKKLRVTNNKILELSICSRVTAPWYIKEEKNDIAHEMKYMVEKRLKVELSII